MKATFLTIEESKKLIGKQISWRSPKSEDNGGYYFGTDIIISVDETKKNPLITKVISGDNLSYAFSEPFTLVSNDNGKSFKAVEADDDTRCLTYSDEYREVEIVESNPIRYIAIYDTKMLKGVQMSFVEKDDENAINYAKRNFGKGLEIKIIDETGRLASEFVNK
jgi:hypothetical protein